MASEIRVDKITSLSGVGTISPSPTGVEIAGITTVGILTSTGAITSGAGLKGNRLNIVSETPRIYLTDTNNNDDYQVRNENGTFEVRNDTDGVNVFTIEKGPANTATFSSTTKVGSGVTLSPDGDVFATGISTFSGGVKTSGGNITISQPAGTNAQIIINEGTTTNGLFLRQTATESLIQTGASQPLNIRAQGGTGSGQHLALWTKESERIRIQSSGNIGIGTSAPATILHVQANAGDMLRLDRQNNAGGVGNQIAFRHNNATGTAIETGSINCVITANADTGQLRFYTKESGGSNTEKLRIMPAGGITFNGDTAYANALDDYEEGVHTVTITCNTSGTITLSNTHNKLAYHKIGNWINVHGRVRVSSTSSPSGQQLRVSLPYQSASEYGGDASRITGFATIEKADENQNHYGIQATYAGNSFVQVGNVNTNTTNPANVCSQVNSDSLITINVTYRTV